MNRFCPLILTLFLFAQILYSQTDSKFLSTQWTTENGLPQNTVTSITQTPDGYLWVGTFGGLARFDGIHFHIFTTSNTPELKSNRITALKTDEIGNLLIGTERGEIVWLKGNKFQVIDNGNSVNNNFVGDIYIDSDRSLWIAGLAGYRICNLDGCSKKEFPNNQTVKFRRDTNGTMWAISKKKLYKLVDDSWVLSDIFPEQISNFEVNVNGGLWILLPTGLFLWRNGETEKILEYNNFAQSFGVSDFNKKDFWVTVSGFIFHIDSDKIEKFNMKDFEIDRIRQLFIDRDGIIWLGRDGGGLVRLINRRVQTLNIEETIEGLKLKNRSVNSIAEDKQGNIWLATNNSLFQIQGEKTKQITFDYRKSNIFRGTLLFDKAETLWNVSSNGLESLKDGKLKLHPEISWENTQSGNSIYEDSKQNLWYGGYGLGVFVSDREKILARYTTENGLVGNVVDFITEARDGAMWFGTTSGMSRLKDNIFTNYTTKEGLSNEYVRDIYEDQEGTIWIGTYGGGLNRLKDGKITAITTKDGLFDDIVSRILVDDDDNFWFLGNRGIYSVSRKMLNDFADGKTKQVYCSAYTTADGLITSEGNGGYQNAAIKAKDGKLWFSMINGVAIIDPKQEKMPPPKPIVEDVVLSGKLVDSNEIIEINPGNESLEINYTGINFRKPEQIRFRYRLEGLDENWTEAGTRRLVNYPYLPAGNFRFQLQASNADGNWSENAAEIKIVVYPYFYQTWWFYILCFAVFWWMFYAVYRYRNWLFDKEKGKQEEFARRLINAQESERRRIASDIHDNLGQQLLIIKNWTSYCLKKTRNNDIRPQVEQVNVMAQQALDEVRLLAKNLSPYHLDKIGLTNTIIYMVKQMAESSEINFETEIDNIDNLFSKENEINLYRIVQESVNNIVKHSKSSKAKVLLKRNENFLKLEISDNGIGFYNDEENDFKESGIGLHGMTERAKMLGGNFVFESIERKGTVVKIEIEIK